MAIEYALYPNHLTADPTDHLAIVQDQETRTSKIAIGLFGTEG